MDCTINVYAFGKARHFRTARTVPLKWFHLDLSHPFPSRSRNSKSACLPCRTIPSLAQSCRQCQLYQKALTSVPVASFTVMIWVWTCWQNPNSQWSIIISSWKCPIQCVIWCDMMWKKSRQTHLWISIVLRFVGKAPPFKVFWIILNPPKTSII